ncbi:MAG: FxLYD domain-containing protein, partial [Phototrophicaceae bacterium]
VANLTQFRSFQPDNLDMTPIVEFLAKDNHDNWRYMTLGFGDQLAWLSAQTLALNVEGNYHSARRLPEMTTTPIERMDGAKYQELPGLGTLHQILSNPQRYNLKYIFSNDGFYDPVLHFYGWHRLGALDNGIMVWERADVPPLPNAIPQTAYPDWQRLMWGILPISSLFVTAFLFLFTAFVPIRPSNWFGINWFVNRGWLQGWLVNQSIVPDYQSDNSWQFWHKYTDRVQIKLDLHIRRRIYSTLLGLIVLASLAGIGLSYRQYTTSPETILLNYYDDIDFKRFVESYDWLETDLTLDEYMRYLSIRGGIVASFAKLENLFITDLVQDGDYITANITLDWLTSLGSYPQSLTQEMVNTENGWRIVLDVMPPDPPTEAFLTTSTTEFYIDLPLGSLAEGALNRGTLDRSLLAVDQVSVVYVPDIPIGFVPEAFEISRFDGRWQGLVSVIGVVQNLDVYPSHVTITAIFRDEDGNRIGESNAAVDFVHQLLPNETTAFRVDLFGADATSLLDINDLSAVELVVRGTPTRYNLDRTLILLDENTLYNT